jgi:hypothetical protein
VVEEIRLGLAPVAPDWAAVEADLAEAARPGLAALPSAGGRPPSPFQIRTLACSLAQGVGQSHGLTDSTIELLASCLYDELVDALTPVLVGPDGGAARE